MNEVAVEPGRTYAKSYNKNTNIHRCGFSLVLKTIIEGARQMLSGS